MEKEELAYRSDSFAYAVYRIASAFASLEDRDRIIDQALARLGEVCNASRAYLFLFRSDMDVMDNTHEWCAPGVSAEIENLKDLPIDMFPWWMAHLRRGEMILVPEVAQMPPTEARAEKEILEMQGIQSVLVLPVYRDGELSGFIGLDDVQSATTWQAETREYLNVAAELVSSTLTRDARARAAEQDRQELQAAYENLKHTQSQLLQSEKLASIGMLAAGVAHEINNPLAYITSNTSTLKEYFDDFRTLWNTLETTNDLDTLRELARSLDIDYLLTDSMDILEANTNGLAKVKTIVTDLMAFARVDTEQHADADLHEGIRSTLEIASNMLKYTADVDFRPGVLPRVRCNLGELNQVFLNILVNASQAIEAKPGTDRGTIRIETRSDGEFVHLLFRDDGPGFPEDILNRVFEPFFTTKEVGTGTGLGMSICYDIVVNKHSGRIDIGNNDDGGAFVAISLPITG